VGLALAENVNDDRSLQAIQAAGGSSFLDNVKEEIAEVEANEEQATRHAKVVEALVFAQPAEPLLTQKLGEAPTEEFFHELSELAEATNEGDSANVSAAIEEIRTLLRQLEGAGESSDLSKTITSLADKGDFVA